MMLDPREIPWIEFASLENAGTPTFVRADSIVGFEKAASGTNIVLIGGSIRVRGEPASVKKAIDAFWLGWEKEIDRRRQERFAAADAAAAAEEGKSLGTATPV